MAEKRMPPRVRVMLLLITLSVYLLPLPSSASFPFPGPMCPGSGAAEPVILSEALSFCGLGVGGLSCCDGAADADLREQFVALNVSNDDTPCTAIVKDIICAKCVPSLSTKPFNAAADAAIVARSLPLLCASPPPSPPRSSARRRSSTSTKQDREDALCLERIRSGSYRGMAPHPDGSSRVFLWTQGGRVAVASVPKRGSARALRLDGTPVLDLTGRVLELMGVAFHREFATNGRFFVTYACDTVSPACAAATDGKNSTAAAAGNGGFGQYLMVVAEFSANGSVHDDSKAARADPSEVRRLFTMDLPLQHRSYYYPQPLNGGQILFPPTAGDAYYLYLIAGHGRDGDHSSDKGAFYGKIIRFDVDRATAKPEIIAIGLNNPTGCSFDSQRPSDLYCAGVDEQQNEQVYLISHQYGNKGSSATAISLVVNHGRPAPSQTTSIVGGLTYDGSTDLSLKGRYLYMYGSEAWSALEIEEDGMLHSARIANVRCSRSTPVPCHSRGIGGRALSLGEDNSKDAFFLSTDGIYRAVEPGLCALAAQPHQSTDAYGWLLGSKAAGGQQQQATPAEYNWFGSGIPVAAVSMLLLYVAYKKLWPASTGQPATAPNVWNSCWRSNMMLWSSSTVTNVNNHYFSDAPRFGTPMPRHGASAEMTPLPMR